MKMKIRLFIGCLTTAFFTATEASALTSWECTYIGSVMVLPNEQFFGVEPPEEPQKTIVTHDATTMKVRVKHQPSDELLDAINKHATWEYFEGRLYSTSLFLWKNEYMVLSTTSVNKDTLVQTLQLIKDDQVTSSVGKYDC